MDLLKVRNAATCKVETTAVLSDGVRLTLDKSEAAPTRALVANCMLNCDMILTGMMSAWTVRLPTAAERGPPGSDGFRVVTTMSGTEEYHRYFAVTFKADFMRRFQHAALTESYKSVPGIFQAAMTKIADRMGNFNYLPDAACRYVCDELNTPWVGAVEVEKADTPARPSPASGQKPVVPRRGRCHAWDSKGSCPRGDRCAYKGAHQGKPSRRAEKRDSPRRDDRERSRDRDGGRDDRGHERERDRDRDRRPYRDDRVVRFRD